MINKFAFEYGFDSRLNPNTGNIIPVDDSNDTVSFLDTLVQLSTSLEDFTDEAWGGSRIFFEISAFISLAGELGYVADYVGNWGIISTLGIGLSVPGVGVSVGYEAGTGESIYDEQGFAKTYFVGGGKFVVQNVGYTDVIGSDNWSVAESTGPGLSISDAGGPTPTFSLGANINGSVLLYTSDKGILPIVFNRNDEQTQEYNSR